jgi:putative tryptophan/tyrosine transport system substrate-binding protein
MIFSGWSPTDGGPDAAACVRCHGRWGTGLELGYVNGQTITIEYLHPEGRSDRYPELTAECLRRKPDIIAVTTTPGAHALKNATSTIPIVMVALGDPVGTKLVDNLSRPGANLTGMSQMTSGLAAKRLEILKEAIPGLSRVLILAYLVDPISPLQVQALKDAAPALGARDLPLRGICRRERRTHGLRRR